MKQYIKFLFAFLFIPNLYGLQFGEVKKPEEVSTQFVAAVKQALDVEVETREEAEVLGAEAFNVFKKENVDGCNIVFWKGDVYLNGLLNVTHVFDDIEIQGKKYRTIQLCEILGSPVEEIETIKYIPKISDRLESALRYFPIKSFWNEAKSLKEDSEIDSLLQEYSKRHPNYQDCLAHEAYYIEVLHSWGVDTTTPTVNVDTTTQVIEGHTATTASDVETAPSASKVDELRESYSKASDAIKSKMNELLKKFGDYISFFDKDDGERFLEGLRELEELEDLSSYMNEAEKLCSTYNSYTHTEYMIRYLQRQSEPSTEPLYALSFYDACKNCERMLAKTTSVKTEHFNTVIVSGSKYSSSRERERKPYLVNKSFLQIQLELK